MPYVNIKVTREGGPDGTGPSADQKAQLIAEVTDLLHRVLGKAPATTFVVINAVGLEDWGVGGLPVQEYRKQVQ
ncbi:tautomerase [Rhodobacterales bacterium 56_14_T64]|nr:tautomerase [Rhodobacterales bacterium 56_14_T64]